MKDLWRRASQRVSTLGRFALLSAVPILLLGYVLLHLQDDFVRREAIDVARQQAALAIRLRVEPTLRGQRLDARLDPAATAELEEAIGARALLETRVIRSAIYNRRREELFASGPRGPGPLAEWIEAALEGEVTAEVDDGRNDPEITVVLPVEGARAAAPAAAVEIVFPYDPIASTIQDRMRTFSIALIEGLVLLYIAVFAGLMRVSRHLRRRAEEKEHLSLHDALTGLPNRALFRDRLRQAIVTASRDDQTGAVMVLDLDRFKETNDTLGHHTGDVVLQETARRLSQVLRQSDTVARLGGDEFGVLMPKISAPEAALHVAQKIQQALRHPVMVQGLSLDVGTSIGIAFFPEHGKDRDTLLQRADMAMYLAKAAQSGYEVYASMRDQHSPNRLALVDELRGAIDQEEFLLHYQPKVSLATGEVGSVEVLLRWKHPLRMFIPPDDFIPLAEHTGLIEPLTSFVLNTALKQCSRWRADGLDLGVSINLSGRSITDVHFPETVSGLVKKWQIPPSMLQFEIAETALVGDPTRSLGVLSRLRQMGISLAIDDFGTGRSSLVQLRALPLDEIKIDRSFVRNMTVDENDAVIVRSAIDLGKNLGLRVVALGAEHKEAWDQLRQLGCDFAQGYYSSRPMPAEELLHWLNLVRGGSSLD